MRGQLQGQATESKIKNIPYHQMTDYITTKKNGDFIQIRIIL